VLLLPITAAVLVAGAWLFWRARRRKRAASATAWMEASCPACIGVSLLTGRVLTGRDPVSGDEPKALVS
jgi:hypothetical protein